MFLLRNQTRPTPGSQEAQQAGAQFQGAFDKPADPRCGFWKAYGRQEPWEESPEGWPQRGNAEAFRINGRPIAQWSWLAAGRSDDLGTAGR